MRTVLVTGSDTGIGKTRVAGALARLFAGEGGRVQVVKPVETGAASGREGDAAAACRMAAGRAEPVTLRSFPSAVTPASAAALAGAEISVAELAAEVGRLADCDWRIIEGAGGIASPIDLAVLDWADFGAEIAADAVVLVIPDRLGAINQARLAWARAREAGLPAGVWLNAVEPVEPGVAASNRDLLERAGVEIWAETGHGADEIKWRRRPARLRVGTGDEGGAATGGALRLRKALEEREAAGRRRFLRVTEAAENVLNLADNDYLGLAHDPSVAAAAVSALAAEGASASASPLITGWKRSHQDLIDELCRWHGFACGLLWTSGYAANSAVLGGLPPKGGRVFADRLIHHSMIAGLQRSDAAWRRYRHLDLEHLGQLLRGGSGVDAWVATESVFSMDGDYPDFSRLIGLKREHGCRLILDEAHALGWYGPEGAGLAASTGAAAEVDVFVGTLGKTLGSGGAYTLFHDATLRDYLLNTAGEFIYSTAIPPAAAAAARAAIARVRERAPGQGGWQAASRLFRRRLREEGWDAPDGDSPIVPVRLENEARALEIAEHLRQSGILAAAVRPPTVPAGTSRLRFSLKSAFGTGEMARVLQALGNWRKRR